MLRRPPTSPPFPYTTLFRSGRAAPSLLCITLKPLPFDACASEVFAQLSTPLILDACIRVGVSLRSAPPGIAADAGDRKSTRLNSSHPSISYAVFCLKKKKKD